MLRRFLAVAVTTVCLISATTAGAAPIQPGAYHETDVGACTLNFIYDGTGGQAGKVFAGTAAHCVEGIGQPVRDMDGVTIGTVAFIGNADNTATDYAFIQIASSQLSRVSPAVKGSPTLPTGVTQPGETALGDLIQLSGFGLGFNLLPITQERRIALLNSDDASQYSVTGPLIFGDSGGPLVHLKTGKALGIVSRLCIGLCTEEGATVQGILAKAAANGFTVRLRPVGG